MKKLIALILSFVIINTNIICIAQNDSKTMFFLLDYPYSVVEGATVSIDSENSEVKPFVENGCTMVPLRFISENCGAVVEYDNETTKITITANDKIIRIMPGTTDYTVNDEPKQFNTPVTVLNGRTFIPLRAIGEIIGLNVAWNPIGIIGLGNERITDQYLIDNENYVFEKLGIRYSAPGTVYEQDKNFDDDFEVVKYRAKLALLNPHSDPAKEMENLQPDGTFSDLKYIGLSDWSANTALTRCFKSLQAYHSPTSKYYKNKDVKAQVNSVLENWALSDYKHPSNPWWSTIGIPSTLTDILILGAEGLAPETLDKLFTIARRGLYPDESYRRYATDSTIQMTGGNLTDNVKITLNIALATDDEKLAEKITMFLNDECQIASTEEDKIWNGFNEGIQVDGSFLQHGPLLYNVGYGSVYLTGLISLHNLTKGTKYGLTKESVNTVVNTMYLDGMQYMGFKGVNDFNITGRGVSGANAMAAWNSQLTSVVKTFMNDSRLDRADELNELFVNRLSGKDNFSGAKQFWRADYASIIRPNQFVGVKTSSVRTKPTEIVNRENTKGYFLGQGVTCIMSTGKEYADIFPLWDWDKVPGTTALQGIRDASKETTMTFSKFSGTTEFVGGAYDGQNVCTTMEANRDGLYAQKSWFMYDRGMTALGANITKSASGDNDVVTTIDQCYLNGSVTVSDSYGVRTLENGTHNLKDVKWLLHNGKAYVFDTTVDLNVEMASVTGNWRSISELAGSTTPITKDVIKIWLKHGNNVSNDNYSYSVWFVENEAQIETMLKNNTIEILSNTEAMQAVWNNEQNILQVIFKQPGSVSAPDGLTVSVDKPCALVLSELNNNDVRIAVANPYSKQENVNVSISKSYNTVNGSLMFELPDSVYAGDSLVYDSSKGGFIDLIKEKQGEYDKEATEKVEPPLIKALLVNGKPMSGFDSTTFIYEFAQPVGYTDIPSVKAYSVFPTEVTEEQTDKYNRINIKVSDLENSDNIANYTLTFNFQNIDGLDPNAKEITVSQVQSPYFDQSFVAELTIDGSLVDESRWSASGDDTWIQYDLGEVRNVDCMAMALVVGDIRKTKFSVAVSEDGNTWKTVIDKTTSSGTTDDFEIYKIDKQARYIKILGYGYITNEGVKGPWTSIKEVKFLTLSEN